MIKFFRVRIQVRVRSPGFNFSYCRSILSTQGAIDSRLVSDTSKFSMFAYQHL